MAGLVALLTLALGVPAAEGRNRVPKLKWRQASNANINYTQRSCDRAFQGAAPVCIEVRSECRRRHRRAFLCYSGTITRYTLTITDPAEYFPPFTSTVEAICAWRMRWVRYRRWIKGRSIGRDCETYPV